MGDIGTKEKILKFAHKLFSEKGFNGVSIREISKAADVNIAAINYHFENKENLFKETVSCSFCSTSSDITKMFTDNPEISISELAIKVFDYFNAHSEDLRTSFKMFVIDSDIYPVPRGEEEEMIGPPGGKVFYECIKAEKPNASHDDIIWALRTIFTVIIHKSLVFNSKCIQRENLYKGTVNDFKELIERLVRVVIADI